MLIQNKQDAIQALEAINPENQTPTAVFRSMCEVIGLIAQDLEAEIPHDVDQPDNDGLSDAVFQLIQVSGFIGEAFHKLISMQTATEGIDLNKLVIDVQVMKELASQLERRIRKTVEEAPPMPSSEAIVQQQQTVRNHQTLCEDMLSGLETPLQAKDEPLPSPFDAWRHKVDAWGGRVCEDLKDWRELLKHNAEALDEVGRWSRSIDGFRRTLAEYDQLRDTGSSNAGASAIGSLPSAANIVGHRPPMRKPTHVPDDSVPGATANSGPADKKQCNHIDSQRDGIERGVSAGNRTPGQPEDPQPSEPSCAKDGGNSPHSTYAHGLRNNKRGV